MALWGGKDQANNSPIFGPSSVNKTPDVTNRDLLFENATPDAFITGETVGVYGNQVTEAGPSGWVLKRIGSGGRAGRTFSEVLVAMGSLVAGDTGGAGGGPYWIAKLGGTTNSGDWGQGVTTDSEGNIYVTGVTQTSNYNIFLAKYNSSGTLLWQRILGGVSTDSGLGIDVDSQNNVYITGFTESQGVGYADILIAKYNSSGVIQWQRTLGDISVDKGISIVVDNLDNLYIGGSSTNNVTGYYDLLIAKYNSSGVIQWQRTLGSNDFNEYTYQYGGIDVDSQNNVYITGFTDYNNTNNIVFAKYNSSGTLQWQKILGDVNYEEGFAVAVDSQDNSYITGYTNAEGAGSTDILLIKYNSSGTIQWKKVIGNTGTDSTYSIAIDSQDNVYLAGESNSLDPNYNCLIIKYNKDGVLQFVRGLGKNPTNYDGSYKITVDSSDNIIITGEHDTDTPEYDYMAFVAKLPSDGSLTGTYGDFTYYEVTDFVDQVSIITDNVATFSSNTSTLTDQVSTLTDQAGNLVSTLITIS